MTREPTHDDLAAAARVQPGACLPVPPALMSPAKGKTMFGIWVTVSGGVTGYREAWVKDAEGKPRLYETEGEAQAYVAERERTALRGGYTPSGRPIAVQTYAVREF